MELVINGANGKVDIDGHKGPLEVNVSNGNVTFEPDSETYYLYNVNVVNGFIKDKNMKSYPEGVMVKISVTNGRVEIKKN